MPADAFEFGMTSYVVYGHARYLYIRDMCVFGRQRGKVSIRLQHRCKCTLRSYPARCTSGSRLLSIVEVCRFDSPCLQLDNTKALPVDDTCRQYLFVIVASESTRDLGLGVSYDKEEVGVSRSFTPRFPNNGSEASCP